MPKGNVKNIKPHQFQKGKSGNPRGGQLHNPVMKAIKRLTNAEIADIGTMMLAGNVTALKKIWKDKTETPLRAMLAAVSLRAIESRDSYAFDVILNRIAGKVKDELDLRNPDGSLQRHLALTSAERQRAMRALEARLKKEKP